MSGSGLSAGYTKMTKTAIQGLTEPMKGASEVAGACLTCSKNKLEVLEGTPALLCSSAGLFIQPYRSRALSSMLWCLKSAGREGEGRSASTLASKMTVFTSRSKSKSWSSPAPLWYPGQACGRAVP